MIGTETIEKIKQYMFVIESIYKPYYKCDEEYNGLVSCIRTKNDYLQLGKDDEEVFKQFISIGYIGNNGVLDHIGEKALFRLYFSNNGKVDLLFENNGWVDEVKDFKHLMYLLDPKLLDLKI